MINILKSPKLYFILINFAVAFLLLIGIGFGVLNYLDKYTRHGHSISVPSFHDLSVGDAERLAGKNQLKVIVVDSLYNESALPGTVQEQYPQSGAQVKANRVIQLTINARGPELIVFPKLNNSPYRQTLQTLESKGFKVGRIEYAPSEFKNLVLTLKQEDQEIETGALVRKGSTIDLVLGSGKNDDNYVPLPCFYGMKIEEALTLLKENYLNIGEIIPDPSVKEEEKEQAVIYQQEPAYEENARIKAGSTVNLHITLDKEKLEMLDSLMTITKEVKDL